MRVRTADLRQGDAHMRALLVEAMGVRAGDRVTLDGVDGSWDVIYIGTAHEPIQTHRVSLP